MSNTTRERAATTEQRTGWTDWIGFAGAILLVNGIFTITEGLVALVGPDTYYGLVDGELFLFDVQGWGWWNLALGVLLILTSVSIVRGAMWARVVGVILAIASILVHMLLMPVQPWWSIIVIAIDLFIIYALMAHGSELRPARERR